MRTRAIDTGLVTVVGLITSAGVPLWGTGYSVTRTGTGLYTVRCDAIRTITNVVLTPWNGGSYISVSSATGNSFNVAIQSTTTAALDQAFMFSATGHGVR